MTKTYLVGPPGSGKTSRLTGRLVQLIHDNVRPDRILALVPQQAMARRFKSALSAVRGPHTPRGEPEIATIYGLAQRHVGLFFPMIAERAGFTGVGEPTFINVEAAQYFLDEIVEPRRFDFDDLKLHRPRLLGQIIDNLNKSAIAGFPLETLAQRLGSAWRGESSRLTTYQRVQDVALRFRQFCLERNLVDFSLSMEVFARHLRTDSSYGAYVAARFRHVLADNLEENPSVMHDFVAQLLATCESALLVEDDPGGYRLFLGADPASARALRTRVDAVEHADTPHSSTPVLAFARAVTAELGGQEIPSADAPGAAQFARPIAGKYWVTMVRSVADAIAALVTGGVQPGDIAVLAPFVEDVLAFELSDRLSKSGIAVTWLRPSRPLHDHPVTRALMTLARLGSGAPVTSIPTGELARALSVCIDGLDVARAHRLSDAASRPGGEGLPALDEAVVWERVGMRHFERYNRLRAWLEAARARVAADEAPLDLFWQLAFTEILSQPGFGLGGDAPGSAEGAAVCDALVRSARTFREVLTSAGRQPSAIATRDADHAFLALLQQGGLAAQRDAGGAEAAVLVAPIYAYLTNDRRSRFQFWLDVGSTGWFERIYQPLTHPYVLSRQWSPGRGEWTIEHEHAARTDMLQRVLLGLAYRCAEGVCVASSQLSITGQEEHGPLARAVQRVLARSGEGEAAA